MREAIASPPTMESKCFLGRAFSTLPNQPCKSCTQIRSSGSSSRLQTPQDCPSHPTQAS